MLKEGKSHPVWQMDRHINYVQMGFWNTEGKDAETSVINGQTDQRKGCTEVGRGPGMPREGASFIKRTPFKVSSTINITSN